jgi:hypothetical protein
VQDAPKGCLEHASPEKDEVLDTRPLFFMPRPYPSCAGLAVIRRRSTRGELKAWRLE